MVNPNTSSLHHFIPIEMSGFISFRKTLPASVFGSLSLVSLGLCLQMRGWTCPTPSGRTSMWSLERWRCTSESCRSLSSPTLSSTTSSAQSVRETHSCTNTICSHSRINSEVSLLSVTPGSLSDGAFPLQGLARLSTVSLGLGRPGSLYAAFPLQFSSWAVTIVTQCRRSRDVIFNANHRKPISVVSCWHSSSQLLISVQKLDKS